MKIYKQKYLWGIFFLMLFIYKTRSVDIVKGDTTPARLVPFTILSGKGIYFDDFQEFMPKNDFSFQDFQGHKISAYPLVAGIASIPIYLPRFLFLKLAGTATPSNFHYYSFGLEKWSAAVIAALGVALFFSLCHKITKSKKTSLVLSLIYGLATPVFSVVSQNLWQHGIALVWLIGSQLALLLGIDRKEHRGWWLAASMILGVLAVWSRYAFLLYLILLTVTCWSIDRQKYLSYLGIFLTGVGLLMFYNLYFYGTIIGTAAERIDNFRLDRIVSGLTGFLASPARGMMVYAPLAGVGLLALRWVRGVRKKERIFFLLNYVFLVGLVALYSAWGIWWGGWGWGNRFIVDAAAPIVLLGYWAYRGMTSVTGRATLWVLVGYSIFVQLVGLWYYPRAQWDGYPLPIDQAQKRLWDWNDNPISRALVVGPDLAPLYRLNYWLSGVDDKSYAVEEQRCSLRLVGERRAFGYRVWRIEFENRSAITWVTAGKYPLSLRQMFYQNGKLAAESPLPVRRLPAIIRPGETVIAEVVVIPPQRGEFEVRISPVQERVAWWTKSCSIISPIKT